MLKFLKHCFPTRINKAQARDTGMAMVLLSLLIGWLADVERLFLVAIPLLVVTMVFPGLYRPVAVVWLGLSHLVGTVVSRILLTVVFFVIVMPVGLLRRLLGIDSLQLKKFRRGRESVMKVREHLYVASDIDRPY